MSRSEIIADYWKLEDKLEAIARLQGLTGKQLTKAYRSQSDSVKAKLRPILLTQLEYLTAMQSWNYEDLKNVIVFPLVRRHSR